ncbi:Bug family tripartite tricarboxylate transporter substrate binding protein [Propionivibrio dicarboxylicus]|uniref:Tripartite-type tricarboxylate transporter, receptor component TctC n=1 Tax=Propionivibrio dicarboxylicus TaxID=83767 RepID=A0A1G8GDR6_9RHOO|nr:tripartite tricarboxylate transporter substrate binding protein [Propionivibrio dicarboxylicus]SDH92519.1 Tripartite-type tricarboxylate transporter, receptor component TctC [Propionivibrio dicarboxylicus]
MIRKNWRAFLAAALLCASATVVAETWPSRMIRIVVPTAPGSSVDIVARLVGEKLGPMLGQTVIVENKPGANGTIGVDAVVNSRDGHTLLLGYNGPLTVSPSLTPKPPYNVQRDLAPIALVVTQPNVLAVRADLKVNSLKELIALAKSKPGTLDYASVGLGSLSNLSMELLKMQSGSYLVHIPFNGGPPAALALSRGDVHVMFAALSNVQPLVKAGKVKLLAVSNAKRSAAVPDLPTVAESGFPGFDATTWNGFLAPASMPAETVARLNKLIVQIVQMPDVQQRLATAGAEVVHGGTPEQFGALLKHETAAWTKVIERSGIKLE